MNKNEKSICYALYWRNSLLDSECGKGALNKRKMENLLKGTPEMLNEGRVSDAITQKIFKNEPHEKQSIEVIVRPKVYFLRREHGQEQWYGFPDALTPILLMAELRRDGQLLPTGKITVPRDIVEPQDCGAYTIGTVEDIDAFLARNPSPGGKDFSQEEDADNSLWKKCLEYAYRLLEDVRKKNWSPENDGYMLADDWYLVKNEFISGASQHIVALYDHLHKNAPAAPLFQRYANEEDVPLESCLPSQTTFTTRMGHASDRFPLARAQRDALSHLLLAGHGDILAVNGPPGTGKTTMLLSVVASLWAQAALEGGDVPVVVAASTNNQAVTNIIDAFGKDFAAGSGPFSGRWLPCPDNDDAPIKSFGAYFPSESKEEESAQLYQTKTFFNNVESAEYLERAKKIYLEKAVKAFPDIFDLTVEKIVKALQEAIGVEKNKLSVLEQAWAQLNAARKAVQQELGADPASTMAQRRQREAELKSRQKTCKALADRWNDYLAQESIMYAFFSWFPPVANKRLCLVRKFFREQFSTESALFEKQDVKMIDAAIAEGYRQAEAKCTAQREQVERGEKVLTREKMQWEIWSRALTLLGRDNKAQDFFWEDCDALADTAIRFPIFLLTTHYWEGRWLLEMEKLVSRLEADNLTLEDEKRKSGRSWVEPRWKRRMMLAPCVVSTFFMLPSHMKVRKRESGQFLDDYLYDFIDMLIVDEAGQVLPEVAGASFALAKKALVIGDTLQIEPIWSISPQIDIGNLQSAKILRGDDLEDVYTQLEKSGKTAARGSVMGIAQNASRYRYDDALARGMFLYEHRRCYDEIIGYCNRLCYKDKLIPKRGPRPQGNTLPAMGYLHVHGICEPGTGGSRRNVLEAQTIAAWLVSKKKELEEHHGEVLSKIVGVVTPFSEQTRTIRQACRDCGIEVDGKNGMTVGTVHSLQGAERPVVIFSSVYTKHDNGRFIDQSPSMLNVAVSRAKESFLLFGDMDFLSSTDKSRPCGLLAETLCQKPENALQFAPLPRRDLSTQQHPFQVLRDAQEHDSFLLAALQKAKREVQIVSPWLSLSRIREIKALEAMQSAVKSGVKVSIYIDQAWNTEEDTHGSAAEKKQRLDKAVQTLLEHGIETNSVQKIHSKLLLIDDSIYCAGSFNWFSASRDSRYARQETSIVYRGPHISKELELDREALRNKSYRKKS